MEAATTNKGGDKAGVADRCGVYGSLKKRKSSSIITNELSISCANSI